MNKKRILHLTLKKIYFVQIALRVKKEEYREIKEYWTKRLLVRNLTNYTKVWRTRFRVFDEIHFTNGYGKDKPFMRVVCKGIIKRKIDEKNKFVIKLGNVLEIKNWRNNKIWEVSFKEIEHLTKKGKEVIDDIFTGVDIK